MQLDIEGIKLFVGLGNPGNEYQNTRHNAGFMLLDFLTEKLEGEEMFYKQDKDYELLKFPRHKIWLLKPLTMMNASGKAVTEVIHQSNLTLKNMLVAHDDLDIKLGEYKIQLAKSPKLHNGVISIEQQLGSVAFYRVRIGIENRINQAEKGIDFVLSKFSAEENKILDDVFTKITADLIGSI
jgi:PTH1 family peptidyl-tRNA hydrolase